jgi:hypothetical protein
VFEVETDPQGGYIDFSVAFAPDLEMNQFQVIKTISQASG